MKSRLVCLALFLPSLVFAGGVVTNCTEAALRAAMAGGGTVTFACDGTITLTNTITNTLDTALDGSGHNVTITGPQAFYVSSNSSLTMISITIANCQALNASAPVAAGAGVFNNGGTVNLKNVVLQSNHVFGVLGLALSGGGAIYNLGGGRLSADNCTFSGNSSMACPYCGPAVGGAIYNSDGAVTLQQCLFYANAVGRDDGNYPGYTGNPRYGGAIYNAGSLSADSCSFISNSAHGGNGGDGQASRTPAGPGGDASGGAIYNQGTLTISRCLFESNSASGGSGGNGATGVTHIGTGDPGGNGANGGSATGGGVYGAGVMNCTFEGNVAGGGPGGSGGAGGDSGFSPTGGAGGNGGNGGNASGGAIAGGLNLINCTIAFNKAQAGFGGAGGPGGHGGQGSGPSGAPGTSGSAGAGAVSGGVLVNSLFVANSPPGSWSGSHNLEMTGPDPNLGPLTNNGGPTLTMALLPGSPAIDAADNSYAPATDQRGVPRPVGPAADIGAFEFDWPAYLYLTHTNPGMVDITVYGNAAQTCRLLVSSNLADWASISTNQIGSNGTVVFQDNFTRGSSRRFYRVAMP